MNDFNSSANPNIILDDGTQIDLDWWTTLAGVTSPDASIMSVHNTYVLAKTTWSIAKRTTTGNPVPYQDPGERWAVSYTAAHNSFSSVFDEKFMNRECGPKLTTPMTRHLIPLSIGTILLTSCLGCTQISIRMNIENALNSLRLLRVAEESYRVKLEHHRYGTLEELYNAGLIDAELGSGTKAGYRFELAPLETSFKLTAVPVQYGKTGDWSFYLDESGVIRGQTSNRKANAHDPPIGKQ